MVDMSTSNPCASAEETIELELLLTALQRSAGVNLEPFDRPLLYKHLLRHLTEQGLANIGDLIPRILHDRAARERLIDALIVKKTSLFRDPACFRLLRDQVIPYLQTFPYFRIWHAGCSTGLEVISMAILLREANLLDRSTIFASDIDDHSLRLAKEGCAPLDTFAASCKAYKEAGGRAALGDYCKVIDDKLHFDPRLLNGVVFAHHDFLTDPPIGTMHLILCRNVLMYYGPESRHRGMEQLAQSVAPHGFITFGHKEHLAWPHLDEAYRVIDSAWRIYQRLRPEHATHRVQPPANVTPEQGFPS